MHRLYSLLSFLLVFCFFFKKIRKTIFFFYENEHDFCSLARTTLSVVKAGLVYFLSPALYLPRNGLCCHLESLLHPLHLISKARQPPYVGLGGADVPRSLVAASRVPLIRLAVLHNGPAQPHCGQKPLLYLFLLAKNQLSEKWNFPPSDSPENQQKINKEIV